MTPQERISAKNKRYYEKHRQARVEYSRKYRKLKAALIRRRRKKYSKTVSGKYGQYRKDARARRIAFRLTLKQFSLLWQKPCNYCGFQIQTIGLDRIDNNKGYFPGNIVPCCTICNVAKNTQSPMKFIEQCARVACLWNKKFKAGGEAGLLRALRGIY